MRSPHGFIVEPVGGKLYNNTKKIGDTELILSSSIESFQVTNREAEVLSVPTWYNGPIEKGAIVVVHHNTFRKYNDIHGKEQFSSDLIKDGTYIIYPDSIFAYKNDWAERYSPTDNWCFIKPIKNESDLGLREFEPLAGTVEISSEILTALGISTKDSVYFTPDSEYEFNIEGSTLYRVDSNDVWGKKKVEREDSQKI
jgi:hypothetical protein